MQKRLLLDFKKYYLFILAAISVLVSNYFILFFFSPTEGWWQTYAYLINQGKKVYIDFHLAFPPLFLFYNSLLMKISDSYLFNRVVGVFVVLLGYLFLFGLLRRFFSYYASLFSALFGVYLFMFSYLYIPNDYHAFVNLFTVISLYLFVVVFDSIASADFSKAFIVIVILSVSSVAVLLVKQNIGLLLIFGILFSYMFYMVEYRSWYWLLIALMYLFLIALFLFIALSVFSMSLKDLYDLIFENDSKGSYAVLLGRFISDKINIRYLIYAFFILGLYNIIYLRYRERIRVFLDNRYVLWAFLGTLVFLLFDKYRYALDVLLVLMLAGLMIKGWRWIKYQERDVLLIVFVFLVLANSLTAEITVTYMYIIIAYFAGSLYSYYEVRMQEKLYYGVAIMTFFVFISLIYSKYIMPYEWWGYPKSGVEKSKYVLPYDELRGLYVNKSTYNLFSTIKKKVYNSSGKVYFYPHIPYFYCLHKLTPYTKNVVQWFDVITTKDMLSDLNYIKSSSPDLVVMLTPPWPAYTVHSDMKNDRLYQVDLLNYFDKMVGLGKYKLDTYQIYDDGLFGDNVNSGENVDFSFRVINPIVIGKTIDELYSDGIIKCYFFINNIFSYSYKVNDIRSHRLRYGDVIEAQLQYSMLNDLMQVFGSANIRAQSKNVLIIYRKI
jgi:hypothetical protein